MSPVMVFSFLFPFSPVTDCKQDAKKDAETADLMATFESLSKTFEALKMAYEGITQTTHAN